MISRIDGDKFFIIDFGYCVDGIDEYSWRDSNCWWNLGWNVWNLSNEFFVNLIIKLVV